MDTERPFEAYRVGDVVVDVGARLVTRQGEIITLSPKTFDLLVELVRRAPGIVRRQELVDAVWPNEFVNDEALTQRLMLLRRSLDDDPKHPTYIAAAPRWGYRVVATVERLDPTPPTTLNNTPGRHPAPPHETRRRGWRRWVALAVVVGAVGLTLLWLGERGDATASVAILPFAAASDDPDVEVLADGIRETLGGTLAQLPRTRVIAASTMSRFRGREIDPQEVGRSLGVGAVLTGRIVQRGELLSISAELVAVEDGTELWGGSYRRPVGDVFFLQTEIASEIAMRLRPHLSAGEQEVLRRHSTDSLSAYQHYLRGRSAWSTRSDEGFLAAITLFQQAIDEDPAYALAYAGLADCYALLGAAEYAAMSPHDAMPQARSAATRALELDPSLAEAYASLGLVQRIYDYDRASAERSLRRAIELNPSYASARQWYAELLMELGRESEAAEQLGQASALDPLSLVISADRGLFAYYRHDWDGAAALFRETLAREPGFVPARLGLALADSQAGRHAESIAELGALRRAVPGQPAVLAALGYALGHSGRVADARAVADDLRRLAAHRYVPAYHLAGVAVGVGDREAAIQALMSACRERCSLLGSLAVEPAFDPLREDPRFAAVLTCAGLGS